MHQKPLLIKTVESNRTIIGLREDGILHIYYKDYTVIDVELQMQVLDTSLELCGNEKHLVIYEAGHQVSINKQARDNALKLEDRMPTRATAVYVQNVVYKMLANFYYNFNRPKQPMHVVTDFNAGIKWLKEVNM